MKDSRALKAEYDELGGYCFPSQLLTFSVEDHKRLFCGMCMDAISIHILLETKT